MIRFGIPIFDDKGQKRGVILLNYFAGKMLASIVKTAKLSLGNVMLVNRDGYWLLSPDKEDEWGFMIENKRNIKFSTKYPKIWHQVRTLENYQINNKDGLFTSSTIYPLRQSMIGIKSSSGSESAFGESQKEINVNEYFWKIVSHIPKKELNSNMRSLLRKLFFTAILLVSFSSIPSFG